jgi:hypothetical protein
MKKQITLRTRPSEAADHAFICNLVASACGAEKSSVTGFNILKKSIDARSRQVFIHLVVEAFINEPYRQRQVQKIQFRNVTNASIKIIIVGAGPAGLFAALRLLEKGIKPVILERGKDVKARRRDLAVLNKNGIINPESNYCFGEGGAGTYSDGKLYTRSTKRGDVNRILNLLVQFGADERILYEAHPHIGTNKLPQIITAIRNQIQDCGGEILFEKKVIDFVAENEIIKKILTDCDEEYRGDAVILATGHSARDIFLLLHGKKIAIELKPFALGVRVEHPQQLIDSVQYHCELRDVFLPPASYNLVQQVDGKGVFSFCMCPGGIIAPAATSHDELVVNGWSPSKRNNPFGNSGMVVPVETRDLHDLKPARLSRSGGDFEEIVKLPQKDLQSNLGSMYFQQYVERKAYRAGGGKFIAPAQRLVDFCENKYSTTLPDCSYLPGIHPAMIKDVLPEFINERLRTAFKEFGKKMRGYFTNEAVVVATESRTSSPVRIPRNPHTLHHPQLSNLYPCGEGAGYAGGIVSAAMDGEKVANMIIEKFLINKIPKS